MSMTARWILGLAVVVACAAAMLHQAHPASGQSPAAAGELVGSLPPAGGFALAVWGGGDVEQLAVAASARGCNLQAIWLTEQAGFIGYVQGAPAVVNQAFLVRFPAASLASGAVILVCASSPSQASGARTIGACPLFPDDNAWAADVSRYPVHPNSDRYIAHILASGSNRFLHADFGSNPDYGIPYVIVPPSQPSVPVAFDYADESDSGPYPIPPNVPIESGSDRHALIVREGECRLYELFDLRTTTSGWLAGSGAIFDLRSNALRPDGWTSADAAGLPILPGLARYDEIRAGRINHALRFTVSRTQRAYIHPATHFASSITSPDAPPMGLRLRLKSDFDLSPYRGDALVVLTALKRYGMLLADNGSNWYISGATDARWDDEDLNQLKRIPGNAFEAVDTGPLFTR
jgi:hypothetical protein